MKFLAGFVLGAVVTFFILPLFREKGSPNNINKSEFTKLPGKGDCITKKELKVFQTLETNMALAEFGTFPEETLVLLINYDDKYYYDGQKIKIPEKMCARQIGTYQYMTKMEVSKTVPVVVIE